MSVVVIGAGVIGASVAWRLAEAGMGVTVLEATSPGAGTSGASFAWTNANNKPPRAYHDLNVAGMQAHARLCEAFGTAPWWHPGGSLEWEAPEQQAAQKQRVERLRGWGYAAEWITRAEARELEPDLDLSGIGDAALAFYPDEGWIDPVPYAGEMIAAATRAGASLHVGVRVVGLDIRSGRVAGVTTQDGQRFPAERVVNCAGCWVNEVVADPALHVPLAPRRGQLVFTAPTPARVRRVVRTPGVDFRPDGAGRLMLSAAEQRILPIPTNWSPACGAWFPAWGRPAPRRCAPQCGRFPPMAFPPSDPCRTWRATPSW